MAPSNPHLETAGLRSRLQRQALRSGVVMLAAQPVKLAIGIGTTAILARLLVPADFGLLAMVAPLLLIVDSLSNLGLETVTVQREELDQAQASAIFWLSLKINACVIGAMVLAGPLLARFYGEPALTPITAAMAVGALSLCVSFQHLSLLKRQMKFGLLTTIEVMAMAMAAVCAIAAARLGLGFWALVLQIVVMQVIQGGAYWLWCSWRPTPAAAGAATNLRPMVAYGAHLTGYRFLTRVATQIDRVLLGYLSGAQALGLYSVAYQWAYFPFNQIYFPLFDVAIASLSRSLPNPEQYRAYCRHSLMPIFAVCMPALAYLFVTAHDVILLLLGSQWTGAIPLFRVLTVAVFVGSLYRVTKWIYVSSGQTQRQLRWSLVYTPVMLVSVALGAQWGALGIALGYTFGICLLTYPSVLYCVASCPITLGDFMGAVWRPAIASLLSAALLYLTSLALPESSILALTLALQGLIYGVFYVGIWLLLPGGYREARAMVQLVLKAKAKPK
ncbi:lipopolysaccharide biosynthesis protein [Nodosilinea sp. PGN35]|uniref:lipopolysaccharide biosynthesis protein n=1 Tax=Nodosilinea sp. PGN35 TaxID=3020489 RepID=UPI0023B2C6D5|nr:lipopolysaccharide biosynthesis protein [Nodosilinea sp. TSF1-S3]MDF0365939.1 lipopolysaccharide biosynthesis protein [Nodosilinea sp. TSF1-S3]